MRVWIAEQSSGSYEDYRSWPVKAFTSEEEGKKWVTENNVLFQELLAKQNEANEERRLAIDALEEKYDANCWEDDRAYEEYQEIDKRLPSYDTYEQYGYSLLHEPIDLIQ